MQAARDAARVAGEKFFNPGQPCKRGHQAERYVSSGACTECEQSRYVDNKDEVLAQQAEYRRDNAEKIKVYQNEWRAQNPDKSRAYVRKWAAANKDKIATYKAANRDEMREYQAAYYEANREKVLERTLAHARANPIQYRSYTSAYRARKRGAEGTYTADDIERILKAQRCKCAMCRVKLQGSKYHIDHIVALFNGGSNWPSNLQLLCPSCNTSKQAKCPLEFARQMGMLL